MSDASGLPELVQRHRALLGAAGALALLLAAWSVVSAAGETREERHLSTSRLWSERAEYTYSVPVTRNSTHYPEGTILPMGETAYFRTVSDHVRLRFAWSTDAPADVEGVAAAEMVVHVQAQTTDGRPYWSIQHTLAEARTASPHEGLVLEGVLDLDAVAAEVEVLARELPASDGVLNWSVRTTVVHALDLGGAPQRASSTYALDIRAADPRYVLPGAEALRWEREHTEERVVTVGTPAGWSAGVTRASTYGPALLGVLLLGAAGSAPRGGAFERELRRHREWVSPAENLPAITGAIDVASLEDLVHVAADARTRVLLDASTRTFYALLPGITYRYARHAAARGAPGPSG